MSQDQDQSTDYYAGINWLNLSSAERVKPTKALYRALVKAAEQKGVSADVMLDEALGAAAQRGTDYVSNFRSGKISKAKAKTIHAWLGSGLITRI